MVREENRKPSWKRKKQRKKGKKSGKSQQLTFNPIWTKVTNLTADVILRTKVRRLSHPASGTLCRLAVLFRWQIQTTSYGTFPRRCSPTIDIYTAYVRISVNGTHQIRRVLLFARESIYCCTCDVWSSKRSTRCHKQYIPDRPTLYP